MDDHSREIDEEDAAERALFGLVVLYGIFSLLTSLPFLFIVGLAAAVAYWMF